jgi:GGDEF domain-containing protein
MNMEGLKSSHEDSKGREYHLRTDDMTGMRSKELLYLPEGIEYLREKFGEEMSVTFGDVAGMGVGNEMLRRAGEDVSAARKNVDDCFALLGSVAEEVFGEDARGRPFEIVRAGGDEIIFITQKNDPKLEEFFRRYGQEKERFLTEERIGREAFDAAKIETNVKAQMKIITKDPEYLALAAQGDIPAMDEWIHRQIGDTSVAEKRTGDLLLGLARERLASVGEEEWIEPLDLYRSPAKEVALNKDTETVLEDLMCAIAKADADIAWIKNHPGEKISDNIAYDEEAIRNTADTYLKQAKGVEKVVRLMQEKEAELASARERGDDMSEERLKKEIIRLETVDPGTGAIRLDKSASKKLTDLFELQSGASRVEIARMDVPYFGVYNNHYDYATADAMMKRLTSVYRRFTGGAIVRDGGSLFALCVLGEGGFPAALEDELNAVLLPYTEPEDSQKKTAMENEAIVKKAIMRQTDVFGKVKLGVPVQVSDISRETTLADALRHVL